MSPEEIKTADIAMSLDELTAEYITLKNKTFHYEGEIVRLKKDVEKLRTILGAVYSNLAADGHGEGENTMILLRSGLDRGGV